MRIFVLMSALMLTACNSGAMSQQERDQLRNHQTSIEIMEVRLAKLESAEGQSTNDGSWISWERSTLIKSPALSGLGPETDFRTLGAFGSEEECRSEAIKVSEYSGGKNGLWRHKSKNEAFEWQFEIECYPKSFTPK